VKRENFVIELLSNVITAHGGLKRWGRFCKLEATVVYDGALRGMRGLTQELQAREVAVWLRQQRSTLVPFGDPDWYCDVSSDRVVIFSSNGVVVADRDHPRGSFPTHDKITPWDPLHLAYFEGYALWTYLNTPFLLSIPGVEVSEIQPWTERGERWRVLRARFPESVATHSPVQEFFFGEDLLLRRHDYRIDVAGGLDVVQLAFDYIEVAGVRIPTRRRAYTRGGDGGPRLAPLMMSIDISDIRLCA